jgi:hypothetical protein
VADEARGPEDGLTVLNKRAFVKLGWGSIFELVSVGGRLVAVGYDATYEESWAGAWTSKNGRTWKRTHRLPDSSFTHALPLAHDAVLAFRDERDGCHTRHGASSPTERSRMPGWSGPAAGAVQESASSRSPASPEKASWRCTVA